MRACGHSWCERGPDTRGGSAGLHPGVGGGRQPRVSRVGSRREGLGRAGGRGGARALSLGEKGSRAMCCLLSLPAEEPEFPESSGKLMRVSVRAGGGRTSGCPGALQARGRRGGPARGVGSGIEVGALVPEPRDGAGPGCLTAALRRGLGPGRGRGPATAGSLSWRHGLAMPFT